MQQRRVEPILLPPRSPNLNAHCERFVRSIKEEALARMIMLGERALYYAIHQNQRIEGEEAVGCQTGDVMRRERLGGLLSYYYREAV
jgi:putative transposase